MDDFLSNDEFRTIESFNDNNDYHTVIDGWIRFGKHNELIEDDFTMDQLQTLFETVV